jgi:hypothetical protein
MLRWSLVALVALVLSVAVGLGAGRHPAAGAAAPATGQSPPPDPGAALSRLGAEELALRAIDPGRPDAERVAAVLQLAERWPAMLGEPVAGAIRQLRASVTDAVLRARLDRIPLP